MAQLLSVKQEIGFQAFSKDLKTQEVVKLVNFVPTDFASKIVKEIMTVIVVNLVLKVLVSRIVSVQETAIMVSIVSKESVLMAVYLIRIVTVIQLVLMENVQILVKEQLIVGIMLFVRLQAIGLSVFVQKDINDLHLVKDVSKLDVKLIPTVLPTNGVTKENVKTHVQIHPPVAKMHNVLLGITKDCVVVLLA